MFKKRSKKSYPPGTFIPTPARIGAIIQLCLAFIIILWNASQPFAGDLFHYKSHLLLYQDVMGAISSKDLPQGKQQRLERNSQRYQELPRKERELIQQGFQSIQQGLQRSFLEKLLGSIKIMVNGIPPFEKAWLLGSIIIPILLLKRVEGASQAVWLLPLITICYGLDNHFFCSSSTLSVEEQLFPSEQMLVQNYLEAPLSRNISEQQIQLLQGWQLYLIKEWALQTPSSNPEAFQEQVEQGEFAFNLERLRQRIAHPLPLSNDGRQEPKPALVLYLLWNFCFAFIAWKQTRVNKIFTTLHR